MTRMLAAAYRAIPFRPHCGTGRHVWLCRMLVPHLPAVTCGDKPDWKDWQVLLADQAVKYALH